MKHDPNLAIYDVQQQLPLMMSFTTFWTIKDWWQQKTPSAHSKWRRDFFPPNEFSRILFIYLSVSFILLAIKSIFSYEKKNK